MIDIPREAVIEIMTQIIDHGKYAKMDRNVLENAVEYLKKDADAENANLCEP